MTTGATVLLTTHAMDEAEHLCDRVAIVDHGRVVACGSPVELTTTATVAETHVRGRTRSRRRRARGRARAARHGGARARRRRLRRRGGRDPGTGGGPHRLVARRARAASASCGPGVARSRTCSSGSPERDAREGRRGPRPDARRDHAHVATRREPARDVGDPARRARVLHQGRRGEHHAASTRSTSSCRACSRSR